MSLMRWEPLRDMMSLQEAMNWLLGQSFVRPATWSESEDWPLSIPIDMVETDDAVIVRADMPGVKPDDVDINITDSRLTMKGKFEMEEEREEGQVHMRERRHGQFQRSVALPAYIDASKVEAEFDSGILKVTLPKSEKAKPKQIPIKVKS
jgi:HSP20 family protein